MRDTQGFQYSPNTWILFSSPSGRWICLQDWPSRLADMLITREGAHDQSSRCLEPCSWVQGEVACLFPLVRQRQQPQRSRQVSMVLG
jgi:hypothetical protein